MTWERWAAVGGLVALALGGVAVVFERSTPNPNPSPAEVVDFYVDNRAALLVQSVLFVLSSGIFLWFLAGLRSRLARAEGHSDRVSSIVHAAGVAWVVVNLVVQAPQIALARAAGDGLAPQVATVVNDMGLALATIADVPVAVMVAGVGVLSLRATVFPVWVGWLSMVVAALHVVAWFGVVADGGPLAPGGWGTFVVYPVFAVWLVAVIVVMIGRSAARVSAPSS
jgi:hypothetical protein